jgi:hypothetical protein
MEAGKSLILQSTNKKQPEIPAAFLLPFKNE